MSQLFRRGDLVGWVADDPKTGDKFLALFNAQDQELAPATEAAASSPLITHQGPQAALAVDITEAQKLYLNVRDGGDGTAWDHADWLNPTLTDGAGKTLALSTLSWQSATAGWGQATVDKSVNGGPLRVAGQTYTTSIGTHANSIIAYDLPAGYTRFTATVGLDEAAAGQNTGGTFQALVFTKSPFRPAPADFGAGTSGPGRAGPARRLHRAGPVEWPRPGAPERQLCALYSAARGGFLPNFPVQSGQVNPLGPHPIIRLTTR